MKPSIRFIHASDLHLEQPPDRADSLVEKSIAAKWTALDRLVTHALSRRVDFMVIAGDVFHHRRERRGRTVKLLLDQLARLAPDGARPVPVFIIHSNHDPGGPEEWHVPLPPHVRVFSCERAEVGEVRRPQGGLVARVVGQSYESVKERRRLHEYYSAEDSSVFNIGLLHTDLKSAGSTDAPCTSAELLANDRIDYWALGHEHAARIVDRRGMRVAAYSGMIQGGDVGEPGLHGALLVQLDEARGPRLELLPTSQFCWMQQDVAIDALAERASNEMEVVSLMEKAASEIALALGGSSIPLADDSVPSIEGFAVRWRLVGRAPVHAALARYESDPEEFLRTHLDSILNRAATPWLRAASLEILTAPPREAKPEGRIFERLAEVMGEIAVTARSHDALKEIVGSALGNDPADEVAGDAATLKVHFSEEEWSEIVAEARAAAEDAVLESREGSA